MENQDQEIAPIYFISGGLGGALGNGNTPTDHLKGTLHQEYRVKSEDLFWRSTYFLKNAYLFRKFQAIFVRKSLYSCLYLSSITPVS